MRRLAAAVALLAAGGCVLRPPRRGAVAYYDFGPPPAASPAEALALGVPVRLGEIDAPAWLDTRLMHYRLLYDEPARIRSFAQSRWAVPPSSLVAAVIRSRLARAGGGGGAAGGHGAPRELLLRIELEEFQQLFDSASSSRAAVRLSATLLDRRGRTLVSRRSFAADVPTARADAVGGVEALAQATRRIASDLLEWVAREASA